MRLQCHCLSAHFLWSFSRIHVIQWNIKAKETEEKNYIHIWRRNFRINDWFNQLKCIDHNCVTIKSLINWIWCVGAMERKKPKQHNDYSNEKKNVNNNRKCYQQNILLIHQVTKFWVLIIRRKKKQWFFCVVENMNKNWNNRWQREKTKDCWLNFVKWQMNWMDCIISSFSSFLCISLAPHKINLN